MMHSLWFGSALLPDGWARDVRISIGGVGGSATLAQGVSHRPEDERHAVAVPGLPNLHSHAFQRAMAGLAEAGAVGGGDDFWSWRALMYQLLARIGPEEMQAIAAMAFVEMLESGFTRVGEFHYLHHQPSGDRYDNPAEMAGAILAAAADTGVALTLLPVFYAHGDFGGQPASEAQRRFTHDIDGFAALFEAVRRPVAALADGVIGIAPHSLRAVTPDQLHALIAIAPVGPVHIHIAEQQREVDACLAWSGQRPVAWLLDHMPVDPRWCLIHATHGEASEISGVAGSGAVVGLCPITEANLGDGIFPVADFLAAGGRFGIGSDSNVRVDATEELRLMEYGQRLTGQRRNVVSRPPHSTGRTLFDHALAGGVQALGQSAAGLRVGARADIVALAADDPGVAEDRLVDRWIFALGRDAIETVWRAGRPIVRGGRHVARERVAASYRDTIRRLAD